MFKQMRRNKRELDKENIERILNDGEYLTLATIGDDGYPYSIPLSYVYNDNCVYIHSAKSGHKVENIKNNSQVSFSIVGNTDVVPSKFSTKYESVVGFGTAYEIDSTEKEEALIMLIKKYSKEFLKEGIEYVSKAKDITNVIKIEIKHITGKGNF